MMDEGYSNFQPGQIVFLEHDNRKLYAEVIQVVVSRQICWVRPLLLVRYTEDAPILTDLRDASDLLWIVTSFQLALDTEVMPFLSQILVKQPTSVPDFAVKQELNTFINQVWQAHQQSREC